MTKPNAQMQNLLDAHAEMGPLPIENLTPEQARQIPLPDRAAVALYGHHLANRALAPLPIPVGKVENLLYPSAGGSLVARVYTPKNKMPASGWPTILYFHGGGFVLANLDTYDASCRALCVGTGCLVVATQYRQAPENPYPAAVNDAFAAYQWISSAPSALSIDPGKVAVAGESAGGNLAAVVSLLAREQGLPAPLHQVLIYPVTDMVNGPDSASALENATVQPLNRAMLSWFYGHYAPSNVNRSDPYLSPLFAPNLAGLPPATIVLAQIDPLRSEGQAYANRLAEAGVRVNLKIYEGVTHEFFGLAGLVHEATEAVALVSKDLKNAFMID